jgi:hypothetical protein
VKEDEMKEIYMKDKIKKELRRTGQDARSGERRKLTI